MVGLFIIFFIEKGLGFRLLALVFSGKVWTLESTFLYLLVYIYISNQLHALHCPTRVTTD
jgi:hypothetical protein